MTVADRILYYRKENKLSQEELGRMLMVSRQTVSLWETGQTAPTIENLIRLKEIFGVSVDAILGCEDNAELAREPVPKEHYLLELNKAEVKSIYKKLTRKPMVRLIVLTVCFFIAAVLSTFIEDGSLITGFLLALFVIGLLVTIKKAIDNGKRIRRITETAESETREYKLFEDCVHVTVYVNGGVNRTQKYSYDSVSRIVELDEYLLLYCSDERMLIFKKTEIDEDSVLYRLFRSRKAQRMVKPTKIKTVSIILFVSTLLSIVFAVAAFLIGGLITLTKQLQGPIPPRSFLNLCSIYHAFLPIPTASIIFGFASRRSGFNGWKKNVIAGFIILTILLFYGSFVFFPTAP